MTFEILAQIHLKLAEDGGRIHPPVNPFRSQIEIDDDLTLSVSIHVDGLPSGEIVNQKSSHVSIISFFTATDDILPKIDGIRDFKLTEGSKIIGYGRRIFDEN